MSLSLYYWLLTGQLRLFDLSHQNKVQIFNRSCRRW
uniref:Uncharacterized protein n=1 Tax=Arundo donax TaxID=35708 RepID=A0A0A8ZRM6_ARUDO